MNIFDTFIGVFAPFDCLNCGAEGRILCQYCMDSMQRLPEQCYICHRLSPQSTTCSSCRNDCRPFSLSTATSYEGGSKLLIWQLKLAGAKSAAKIMAEIMVRNLNLDLELAEPDDARLLVPIPTATSRVRQRGYDQAKLLAHELSRLTGLPYLGCLTRSGQTHQHGSSRSVRLHQLDMAFRVKPNKLRQIKNKELILVDDVVTTGATLETATKVLLKAGVSQISAVVFAQPPRTSFTKTRQQHPRD